MHLQVTPYIEILGPNVCRGQPAWWGIKYRILSAGPPINQEQSADKDQEQSTPGGRYHEGASECASKRL